MKKSLKGNEIIAVSSQSLDGLTTSVDPRFGRCRAFTIVKVENGKIVDAQVLENASMMASGGAGVQAAQLVGNTGAKIVLTGNVGPNASQALQGLGIAVYIGASGIVESAINAYLNGTLQQAASATVPSHFGMGRGGGGGMGRGGGRGMGRGDGGRGRW
ncbi:MAG: NifB/NifX family molybdenum-iron cluster-binding protein [Candidatus Helarchaeota archaeon]|nr:NifB/NifX family molybdenum-iron cluster-binding protein [Candidatus Helarchaeota archaeon]